MNNQRTCLLLASQAVRVLVLLRFAVVLERASLRRLSSLPGIFGATPQKSRKKATLLKNG